MASQTKTFNCKYCEITGLNRSEYLKHTKTEKHKIRMKNMVNGTINRFKMNELLMRSGKCRGTHKTVKFHTGIKDCDSLLSGDKKK